MTLSGFDEYIRRFNADLLKKAGTRRKPIVHKKLYDRLSMHTTKIDDITFHHNGAFDGEVIVMGAEVKQTEYGPEVRLPFTALKRLVAEYVRYNMIAAYESASSDEVLFGTVVNQVMLENDQ